MGKVERGVVGLQSPHRKDKRHKVDAANKIFDNQSCREGEIAEVLQKKSFYGCLLGSVQVEEFLQSDRRTRFPWRKDKYSVIGKVAAQRQVQARSYVGNRSFGKGTNYGFKGKDGKGRLKGHNNNHGFCASNTVVDRCSLQQLEISSNHGFPFFQLPDDVISRRVNADNKFYVHSQKMDDHLVETKGDGLCVTHCSASSCSSNDLHNSPDCNCNADSEDQFDNPNFQSSYHISSLDFGRNLVDQVHELEFYAYRSTLQALYASGPLSWEQESLLTNLRISLHISDEEHLLLLRRLLSTLVM